MKKILVLSLIFIFGLALGGCVKKSSQPIGSLDSSDYNQNGNNMPAVKTPEVKTPLDQYEKDEVGEDNETSLEIGVTKEDLENLKKDINAMEFEDLTGLSE